MKKIYTFVFSLVLGFLSSALSAQAVSLPYQMNFEANESAELSNWVLNPGASDLTLLDQWMVGTSMHSAGRQSLYISNDTSKAWFDTVPCVQYAYREMIIPQGTYILNFDWYCVGAASSSLYVGMGNFSDLTLVALEKGSLPNTIANPVASSMLSQFSNLKGSETWQNATYTSYSDGVTPLRLVFAWVNNNRLRENCNIGACIDNIVITNANCKQPSNIVSQSLTCDSALVSWTGNSSAYEVAYRQSGTQSWLVQRQFMVDPNNYSKASAYLTNLTEGSYEIRVRGICPPDTSAWTYASELVIFCPELHCVNFTDLTSPTVTCTYGTTDRSYSDPSDRAHAYDNVGIVDYGSESILSRHTVNWDKTATDPRTGGKLPLIPKGGYASVRLGNWEDENGAESITYEYVVDSSNAVVLMQYAVVLEDPDGHGDDSPRFLLEILDANNNLIEPTCGQRNFVATYVDRDEWISYKPEGSSSPVLYKPWTTVGLNLRELNIQDGELIRVRLTTFDCFWGAHYGYAYFTLDCAKATIETASCAKDMTSGDMTLVAPEGFTYEWYKKDTLKSTERIFHPGDTATYRCRLTSTENKDCFFDLYSACVPRLPMPRFSYQATSEQCLNRVDLTNESYVLIVQDKDTIHAYNEHCDAFVWTTDGTLSDGKPFTPMQSSMEAPVFYYPPQGGHFRVYLQASLIGGCDSTIVQEFDLPDITLQSLHVEKTICRPANKPTEPVWMDELSRWISVSGVYADTLIAENGCDSVIIYNVTINNSYNLFMGDTILCYGETLQVGDSLYDTRITRSGIWGDYNLKSAAGCDSMVYYNVRVMDSIMPTIKYGETVLSMPYHRIDMVPGQTKVKLQVEGQNYSKFVLEYASAGVDHAESYNFGDELDSLSINQYIFRFFNSHGCEYVDTVLVGGDTICIDEILPTSQIQCDCGTAVLWIPYEKCRPYNKARVDRADVKFALADRSAQGFRDTTIFGLREKDTIRIAVPKRAEPGTYPIDVIFDTIIGGAIWGQNAFHTSITLTYDSSVIFHRWNENAILSLKNASTAKKADGSAFSGYEFTEFQWLHNGEEVTGANLSYMEQQGLLNMSDRYQLRLTRADGAHFTTCAYIPSRNTWAAPAIRWDEAAQVTVTPTWAAAGQVLTLTVDDNAHYDIYSSVGALVQSGDVSQGVHTLSAPYAPGIYIMNVYTRGEETKIRIQIY